MSGRGGEANKHLEPIRGEGKRNYPRNLRFRHSYSPLLAFALVVLLSSPRTRAFPAGAAGGVGGWARN
jgi:hypothetical protein